MLTRLSIPGLFITGTDTGVGKTVVAAAIAACLRKERFRVSVCKPCATGCHREREGLVSDDAELLAHCADSPHGLDLVCPQKYADPLAPAIAADRAGRPLDWEAIDRAIQFMSRNTDVMVIEGTGGILVPMDAKHTVLDMAAWLGVPAVVVARPSLGTINHTLLTLQALRSRNVRVAGVVINRYPTDTPGLAEETSPNAIHRFGKVPILSIVPDANLPKRPAAQPIPPAILEAIKAVDWPRFAGLRDS